MKCIPASRGGVLDQQQASSSLLSLYWAEFKISFPCWKQSHTVAAQANLTCENPGLNILNNGYIMENNYSFCESHGRVNSSFCEFHDKVPLNCIMPSTFTI